MLSETSNPDSDTPLELIQTTLLVWGFGQGMGQASRQSRSRYTVQKCGPQPLLASFRICEGANVRGPLHSAMERSEGGSRSKVPAYRDFVASSEDSRG